MSWADKALPYRLEKMNPKYPSTTVWLNPSRICRNRSSSVRCCAIFSLMPAYLRHTLPKQHSELFSCIIGVNFLLQIFCDLLFKFAAASLADFDPLESKSSYKQILIHLWHQCYDTYIRHRRFDILLSITADFSCHAVLWIISDNRNRNTSII